MSKFILTAVAALCIGSVQAANVGNYAGSSRSWNSGDMSTMKSTAIAAGHTVEANGPMDANNLGNDHVFIIGEPTVAPSGAEIVALANWVNAGGIAIVLSDSGCGGCTGNNAILAGIGSSITVTSSSASGSTFVSSPFTQSPFNIVGQTLNVSPGSAVTGGSEIVGSYIRYQKLGKGYVIVLGDRSDHNIFSPSNATANGQVFLDILAAAAVVDVCDLNDNGSAGERADAIEFLKGCIGGTASYVCDQNQDGTFKLLSDLIAWSRACRAPAGVVDEVRKIDFTR